MSDNCNTHKSVGVGPGSRVGPTVYNKIERTPSGHQFEVDDSAGNERIRRQHTTGTYEEFDATGGRTVEVVGENFTACCSGNTLVVNGVCDITIRGNCNLRVDQTQDPETGEPTGGDLKVEAENIYLNSRKNMELNAGGHLSLETRQPKGNEDSEDKALGGDIGITSAGGYNLKVNGQAFENFQQSLETTINRGFDLTIVREYDVEIIGDFIQRATGQTTLSADEKLKLHSEDQTIITANNDIKIESKTAGNIDLDSEQNITFNSDQNTIFDSALFKVNSGPVKVIETIDADGDITGGSKSVSLNNHTHGQPATGKDAVTQGDTLPPN